MLQPGLIWGCALTDAGTRFVDDCGEHADCGFRWLHLNLADQRSHRWIERMGELPAGVMALMLSRDAQPRAMIERGVVGLILQDFERDFDATDMNRLGTLHIALGPKLMLTGRYHPLQSPDIVRQRIGAGSAVADPAEALDLAMACIVDSVAAIVLDTTTELMTAEDELLAGYEAPEMRELVGLRRRAAQMHRMIGGMRATLRRLEVDAELPQPLAPVVARFSQRLAGLDGDVLGAQNQLKLLRDELDLQAAQRSNQNIYFLSVMTALMMPATLVTGFFGMNTGGLPFANGWGGTIMAALVAALSSGGTYFALRMLGLVRRQ